MWRPNLGLTIASTDVLAQEEDFKNDVAQTFDNAQKVTLFDDVIKIGQVRRVAIDDSAWIGV